MEFNHSKVLRGGYHESALFYMAMAHWQLGDKDQARAWYEKGVDFELKHHPNSNYTALRRWRAEAAELLGIEKPTPPKKN